MECLVQVVTTISAEWSVLSYNDHFIQAEVLKS